MFRFALFCICLLAACQPESLLPETEDPKANYTGYDASIEVQVIVCDSIVSQQCVSTYPGSGALVELYDTPEDREYSEPVVQSGVANSTGKVNFSGLDGGKRYYLRTYYSTESVETSETTPANGIAKHEVLLIEM
jgi:hypothetical protein